MLPSHTVVVIEIQEIFSAKYKQVTTFKRLCDSLEHSLNIICS